MAVTFPKVYTTTSTGPTGTNIQNDTTNARLDEFSRGGMFGWGSSRHLNTGASAGVAANAYRGAAEGALGGAQGTLNSAYGIIRSQLDGIINGNAGIDGYLQQATSSYGKINQFAQEAKASAAEITNSAVALGEYEPLLREMGETMFGEGGGLVGSGNEYINTGLSILGLDQSAGGLAGTYAQVLAALDPSLAVTMAASDTRGAFESQIAANEREMSRRGVSAGSGQNAALMQQAGRALATALAATKTKTRMSANKDYFEAMRGAVADVNALGNTGASIATQGVNAQNAGANTVKSAAGILVDQGQLHAAASNALTAAGQLTTASGNLALGAANAANTANSNRINAASTEFNAAARVAEQQNTAASYYAGMFDQYAQLAGSYYLFAS